MRNQAFIFSVSIILQFTFRSDFFYNSCQISSALLQIQFIYHAYRASAYNHHSAAETASKLAYRISVNAPMIIRRYNVM